MIARAIIQPDASADHAFLRDHLVTGGQWDADPTEGRQAEVWRHLRADGAEHFDSAALARMVQAAKREDLREHLRTIQVLEPLLAAAEVLLATVLSLRDLSTELTLDYLNKLCGERWPDGFRWLDSDAVRATAPAISEYSGGDEAVELFVRLAGLLRDGHWSDAISEVVAHNTWVMKRRGGGPWLRLRGDTVVVERTSR